MSWSRNAHYEDLKILAREKRQAHGVRTEQFGLREIRRIYSKEGIRIDPWPLPRRVKAIYACTDGPVSVAVQQALPDEPKLFALSHELKHHYVDRKDLENGIVACGDYNENQVLEIGAEVFAAEFIYPEEEFLEDIGAMGDEVWSPEKIVHFKRSTCRGKVSYAFICKRLERAQLILREQVLGVKFKRLEEEIYGVPFYRKRFDRGRA